MYAVIRPGGRGVGSNQYHKKCGFPVQTFRFRLCDAWNWQNLEVIALGSDFDGFGIPKTESSESQSDRHLLPFSDEVPFCCLLDPIKTVCSQLSN